MLCIVQACLLSKEELVSRSANSCVTGDLGQLQTAPDLRGCGGYVALL